MNPIRVIIVDDHKIVRDGLRSLLIGIKELEVIGDSPNGNHLLQSLNTLNPDVVIVDVAMPGMTGIELTKILAKLYPAIQVLILSANDDKFTLSSAMKAGAMGYLSKDVTKDELIIAIKKVSVGQHYFGMKVHKTVFESLSMNNNNTHKNVEPEISEREKKIIQLFAEGYSYKQIAEKLFISVRTVESHKKNILKKLKFNNTIDLVKYAIREEIIKI